MAGKSFELIDAFRPSEQTQTRISYLLDLAKGDSLNQAERVELEDFLQLEHLMIMAKARARAAADAATVPESVRRFVAERACHRCECCLLHEGDSYKPHQVDHILSRKQAGSSDPETRAASLKPGARFDTHARHARWPGVGWDFGMWLI